MLFTALYFSARHQVAAGGRQKEFDYCLTRSLLGNLPSPCGFPPPSLLTVIRMTLSVPTPPGNVHGTSGLVNVCKANALCAVIIFAGSKWDVND